MEDLLSLVRRRKGWYLCVKDPTGGWEEVGPFLHEGDAVEAAGRLWSVMRLWCERAPIERLG